MYPSSDKQLPGLGPQPGFDRFRDSLSDMTRSGLRNEPPGSDPTRSPEAELMDTVAHLQLEVDALRFGQLGQTFGGQTTPVRSKPVVFTSTKVPKFAGVTSWEQYRHYCTVEWVGRCYSCLEGDALNAALLVPEAKRAMWTRLVGALTEHYGSPGRLADYRRQFERTAWKEGEDPSIFAIALETLAVKAFGDMGPTARLRLLRDRFFAGPDNCSLR